MLGSSESWRPQQHPHPWHFRPGGGAVHSIRKRPYASQQKKRAGAVSYSITSPARTCHHQLGLQIFHPQPITRLQYEELVFERQARASSDRHFAHVRRYFMPFFLRPARIVRGMRALDIAPGTGLSAEPALSAVGPTGHVTAADVSPAMAEKARERLGEARNAS